jgi:hypothetical protein
MWLTCMGTEPLGSCHCVSLWCSGRRGVRTPFRGVKPPGRDTWHGVDCPSPCWTEYLIEKPTLPVRAYRMSKLSWRLCEFLRWSGYVRWRWDGFEHSSTCYQVRVGACGPIPSSKAFNPAISWGPGPCSSPWYWKPTGMTPGDLGPFWIRSRVVSTVCGQAVESCLSALTAMKWRIGTGHSWIWFLLSWWLLLFSQEWWVIYGMRCMVPQPFAIGENRSYLDLWVVTGDPRYSGYKTPTHTFCIDCTHLPLDLIIWLKLSSLNWTASPTPRFLIKNRQPYPADLHRHAIVGSPSLNPTGLPLIWYYIGLPLWVSRPYDCFPVSCILAPSTTNWWHKAHVKWTSATTLAPSTVSRCPAPYHENCNIMRIRHCISINSQVHF